MKKLFAVISMVAFFAAVSAPAFASNGEKPKAKKETTAKSETKAKSGCATTCGEAKKTACDQEKK